MLNLVLGFTLALASAAPDGGEPETAGLDTAQIEKVTGARGWFDEQEGTFRVSVPRNDVSVFVVGNKMLPQQGLTSWATFKRIGDETLMVGELILTEEQVPSALKMALDESVEVTALHNGYLWDLPRVMVLHVRGKGQEADVSYGVGALLSLIHDPRRPPDRRYLRARKLPPKTKLNLKKMESLLGLRGELQRGIYKVALPGVSAPNTPELSTSMGNQTWMAFAGLDARAVVNGEFSVTPATLQGTLKALVDGGLIVTAIHTPMFTAGNPVGFVHFWGVGTSDALARGLKSALDASAPKP
jgi:hypothetical protein